jgi:SLAP domain-containing protein
VQIIRVTVFDKDSHKPISAANVKVVVMTGFTKTNQFSGSTDSAGRISFSLSIGENGTYKIAAQTSKDGYSPASALASFLVTCHPPVPPPSPHDGNNAVTGLSNTLQFQKYFKEFTDMPANSSVYITSTSMHKDTLGNIVITGEIKNNGTNTANFVELIATFYDTSNQTLGNKNTFTEPTTLQPKQAAPFSMYLSPNDTPLNKIDHVKYHLDWQNGG